MSNPQLWRHLQSVAWSVHPLYLDQSWHWSEPIKFTENQLRTPKAFSQLLRGTCSSTISSNMNSRNYANYHLLNQQLHVINCCKYFTNTNPLATECHPRTSRSLMPTWDLMNHNLHYFEQENPQVKTWVQVLGTPPISPATLISSPLPSILSPLVSFSFFCKVNLKRPQIPSTDKDVGSSLWCPRLAANNCETHLE